MELKFNLFPFKFDLKASVKLAAHLDSEAWFFRFWNLFLVFARVGAPQRRHSYKIQSFSLF